MPSLTVALLLLEWLYDGVYAGRCWVCVVFVCSRAYLPIYFTYTYLYQHLHEQTRPDQPFLLTCLLLPDQ